MSQFRNSY